MFPLHKPSGLGLLFFSPIAPAAVCWMPLPIPTYLSLADKFLKRRGVGQDLGSCQIVLTGCQFNEMFIDGWDEEFEV